MHSAWESNCAILWKLLMVTYRESSNYRIALGEKKECLRGAQGSRRSDCDPNENLKERCSSGKSYIASLVFLVLILSSNCEIEDQIAAFQYYRNTIITGPTVRDSSVPNLLWPCVPHNWMIIGLESRMWSRRTLFASDYDPADVSVWPPQTIYTPTTIYDIIRTGSQHHKVSIQLVIV